MVKHNIAIIGVFMLLEVQNLVSGYGESRIVNDISIHVEKGELVVIIGPNGSGKSTFMKTIIGQLKPFSGSILFNGKKIGGQPTNNIVKEGINYVPQLDNVFGSMTIKENLEMGSYLTSQKSYSYEELYELFPALKGREKEKARNLSGGERQMLAMARALINKPTLLCLDEPTAALAPNLVIEILKKLIEIKDLGTSILLIEQNAKQSLNISDRGYVFVNGKKAHEGVAKSLLESELIQEHYLGVKQK